MYEHKSFPLAGARVFLLAKRGFPPRPSGPGHMDDCRRREAMEQCWCLCNPGGGTHGKGRSEKLARIRPVAQGKCRRRFGLGDWNASDGIGGSLFTTTRQSDRSL
jgi:hypothetical protein